MTLTLRNAILLAGAGLNLLILILFGFSVAIAAPAAQSIEEFLSWLLPAYNGDLTFLLFLQLFSLGALFVLYSQFRKTASPEIFFFLLFLLSLGIEGIRGLPLALRIIHTPYYLDHLVVRSIYMARLFAVFCLFAAGLFANGMQYQKLSIAFGIALLTAFTLASLLPVADGSLKPEETVELFVLGDVAIVLLTLKALSVVNFAAAWIRSSTREYLWLSLAALMVLIGNEGILLTRSLPLRLAGAVVLVTGTLLFARRTHEIYLWI